jgi:hypothetical protein
MFLSSLPKQKSLRCKWIVTVNTTLMAGEESEILKLNVYNTEPYYNCAVHL